MYGTKKGLCPSMLLVFRILEVLLVHSFRLIKSPPFIHASIPDINIQNISSYHEYPDDFGK